jgi:hypothetical protein
VPFGAGLGLVVAPITTTALSGMPADQVSVAGAVASTARQTGATIGVAVTGSIISAGAGSFVAASHAAWAVMAGCGVGVLLLGIVSTRPRGGSWALRTAERNGQRLAAQPTTARGHA